MEVNRAIQSQILTFLLQCYSNPVGEDFNTLLNIAGSKRVLADNLVYFKELGLIDPDSVIRTLDGHILFNSGALKLTAKGVDFLADDGGISAILNTITVKIHNDSLARLESFVRQASIDPPVKEKILAQLKSLPADATKHVVLKLVDLALENSPKAIQLLQTILG